MVQIDFNELGLDVFGGTILGALGSILEYTVVNAVAGTPGSLFTGANAITLSVVVGALIFAGAIYGRVGSNMYKASKQ